ncbi:MAG: hypothetical protein JSR46_08270 [Verrucomicrobia bacterium]|nr:hypothetical protein [Verrucomicrobiota bacterium]
MSGWMGSSTESITMYDMASKVWTDNVLPWVPVAALPAVNSLASTVTAVEPSHIIPALGLLVLPNELGELSVAIDNKRYHTIGRKIAVCVALGTLIYTKDFKEVTALTVGMYLAGKTIQLLSYGAIFIGSKILDCFPKSTVVCQWCNRDVDAVSGAKVYLPKS